MSKTSLKKIISKERSSYEIIPLSIACSIASFLRRKKLRKTAFPFDWNVTPIQSAIELLGNDFDDYLKKDNLVFLPSTHRLLFDEDESELKKSKDIITPVVCKKYKILFSHDFPESGEQVLDEVINKYSKRINRLKDLLFSNTALIFVANDGQLNDWQKDCYLNTLGTPLINNYNAWDAKLSRLIDTKYPTLTYTVCDWEDFLAIVDDTPLINRLKYKIKRLVKRFRYYQ